VFVDVGGGLLAVDRRRAGLLLVLFLEQEDRVVVDARSGLPGLVVAAGIRVEGPVSELGGHVEVGVLGASVFVERGACYSGRLDVGDRAVAARTVLRGIGNGVVSGRDHAEVVQAPVGVAGQVVAVGALASTDRQVEGPGFHLDRGPSVHRVVGEDL